MKQKYIKPYARSIGEIKNAQGYCLTLGSSAHVGGANNCTPGLLAVGAYCGFGGGPDTNPAKGCSTGTTPGYNGCSEGYQAVGTCSVGDSTV